MQTESTNTRTNTRTETPNSACRRVARAFSHLKLSVHDVQLAYDKRNHEWNCWIPSKSGLGVWQGSTVKQAADRIIQENQHGNTN